MVTLKALNETIQQALASYPTQYPTDQVKEWFLSHLGEFGLVDVEEFYEEEEEALYYDLIFQNERVVSVSVMEGYDEGDPPTLVVLASGREFETELDERVIDEDGGVHVSYIPVEFLVTIVKKTVANESKLPEGELLEIFRYVIRGGKKVKKRVVRKRRKRLSPKQKAALRKARRFANKAGAMRKRKLSNRKRKVLHLKAGINKRGSIRYKLTA